MSHILDNLNPAQREAVTAPAGPLLVLAGAGSGKTRVLTRRIAWLLDERGASADSVAGLTFTNKAADEMRGRIDALVGARGRQVLLHTFHALGARLLREYGTEMKIPPSFLILDDDDSLALVKESMRESGCGAEFPGGAAAILDAISSAKAAGLGTREFSGQVEDADVLDDTVARIYELYEKKKRLSGGLDFDDLILLPTRLLTECPAAAEAIHTRVRHVLVDEYQDTSHAQYLLTRALAGTERDLTCVGDPDQSIYRWRGADIRNIIEFTRDFPDARTVTMEINYRSTGLILEAASELIKHNQQRVPKGLRSEGGPGRPAAFYQAVDEIDEARFMAETVSRMLRGGDSPGDFAVLYRTHAQSRALEEALAALRVPYAVVGGTKFYARREVKDMLAYLRLLASPGDGLSLARALGSPPRGVGETSLARLRAAAETAGHPVLEMLADLDFQAAIPARARPAVREFLDLLGRMRKTCAERGFAAALAVAVEESGYLSWIEGRSGGGASPDRRDNLRELLEAAREAEAAGASAPEYLEKAALMADIDYMKESGSFVTLMTLHNAKGLEFRRVFICGLEDGLLPHASSFGDPSELEEERRLLYVGITRARETLVLTAARGRRQFDQFKWGQNSRFLGELPPSVIVEVETPAALSPGEDAGHAPPAARTAVPPGELERIPVDEEWGDDGAGFAPGDDVIHGHFGAGRVLSMSGRGRETRVVVSFPRAGVKTLLAARARLVRA